MLRSDSGHIICPRIHWLKIDWVIAFDIAAIASHNQSVTLLVEYLGDLTFSRWDSFEYFDSIVIFMVYFNYSDIIHCLVTIFAPLSVFFIFILNVIN